jgi:hypothetical protein
MKVAVVAFVVGAVTVLGACGRSTVQTDPFVGTWRMDSGDHPRWVITELGGKYTVAQGTKGAPDYLKIAVLDRSGGNLHGNILVTTGVGGQTNLAIDDSGKHIDFVVDGEELSSPITATLTKLSDSTEIPTPVP